MTSYFIDTSALAKRYISEIGSVWLRALVAPSSGNVIIICELAPIEVFRVLRGKESSGIISPADVTTLQNSFLTHYKSEYISVLLSPDILLSARALVAKHQGLGTLDAIQLASAIDFRNDFQEPLVFIAADKALKRTAAAEGFVVDDPHNYP